MSEPSEARGPRKPGEPKEPLEELQEEAREGGRLRMTLRYSLQALKMVWASSRGLTSLLMVSSLVAGIAPAGAAYVARVVIDEVLIAATKQEPEHMRLAFIAIGIEALLITAVLTSQRLITLSTTLLKARLAHSVRSQILTKAVALSLADFERSEVHDRMEEARREASLRPLSVVSRTFLLLRYGIALGGYLGLLFELSPYAVLALLVAGVPAFLAETVYADRAFRFFRSQSPENRERNYLESLLTRVDFKKEVGFFGLGPFLLNRYDSLFSELYAEDQKITTRRHLAGIAMGAFGIVAFFVVYAWIVHRTVAGELTLGQMTMYLVVFRQGQTAISNALLALGGLYEDHLYLHGLEIFLALPSVTDTERPVDVPRRVSRISIGAGLRVEGLSYTYPDSDRPALEDVSFSLPPGQTLAVVGKNGSGKSTLVKLLTRRYLPTEGAIYLDDTPLEEWSEERLRARISVLFQDFRRYKLTAGENIGAGDPARFEDEERWREAAEEGDVDSLIAALPESYHTRLGKAFRGARELSGGQWQRLALARSLMRQGTELLLFDEPTSAADPERQAAFVDRLEKILEGRSGIVISHQMATARIADHILVLDQGRVLEEGTHEELMELGGLYAKLFTTQADSYK